MKISSRKLEAKAVRKVAIIGSRGYPSFYGGFETAVRHVAPHLANLGWGVTVYGRKASTAEVTKTTDMRIRSVLVPCIESKSLSTLTSGFSSAVHCFFTKPDVALVLNVANGFWLPLLKLRGIRTVVNVDGLEWKREKWGLPAKAIFFMGAKMVAMFADTIVCDARVLQKHWATNFKRDSVFIPYGGIIEDQLSVPLNLAHRGYVLLVARFVPENTISEFFEAVPQLQEKYPIVLVGSSGYGGDFDNQARYLAENFENVTWLGQVSDDALLHSLWQHSGAYFHGHSVGGTNPALVQAMSSGAPIIARDTAFNREVLGAAGVFTKPHRASIASGIQDIMGNPGLQESLSTRSVERATADYSWEKICFQYEQALK
jgi:glycosyltransferase involved in cell wall biosynthesis